MMTPSNQSIYASPTTEDDGWVEGDYEGSPEEQEEQAQEDWEDAGRPGELDEDNDDDGNDDNRDDEEQIFRCSDGSTVSGDEECPSTGQIRTVTKLVVIIVEFVMIEKITVSLPVCIHVMMEHRKNVGKIVKMLQRMIMTIQILK
jgi:hypothetical protein